MNFHNIKNQTAKGLFLLLALALSLSTAYGEKDKKDKDQKEGEKPITDTLRSIDLSGLSFRSIGPALTSGRIADFAVNPQDHSEYYVAVASGHIWKTLNNGNTFDPVFDNYGAYSIGCLAMDPTNHNVVWAGTGENNHQRALGYGDGVYKTTDGGKSWTNMGLKSSRQIGMIAINPDNPDIVFVAAEGSVWGPGGDRGLYRTTDGGKAWEKVLEISENTGVNNVIIHPKNHNIMFASSEQRRRHIYTKIGGGPESAIYKSTDGGKTWNKVSSGLPGGDMGGIGIAVSPVNPDYVYAIIEAAGESGGFFRSTDCGESWSKMSGHYAQGQYYNEIYCDPKDVNKVYSAETVSQVTEDGGKTWRSVGNNGRHVDDHAFWIDPNDTKHIFIGGDGGVYETFDGGANWLFKTNLPVTQFYRVNVDDTEPFYWVYGGTQDNNSLGGPSRNICREGVQTYEWITTLGGDGFWQAIEPGNPNIIYSAYQYGNIYRYDKKSGEAVKIRPEPVDSEQTYKWNWDAPFILSPHSPTRLYMAADKVFRSDDRGNSWKVISGDITSGTDRNSFQVMGRYWGVDAVAKDISTSLWGTAVSLAESPIQDGLVYVGTNDGVLSITEDAGQNWTKVTKFPGIPEYTYISDIFPDRYDANVVYVSFSNIQRDDMKAYLLKSTDKGKSWTSIVSNLPAEQAVHTINQDFIDAQMLFVGTEFGVYVSLDGGKIWNQITGNLPTIKVADIVIQQRECDLVLGTFGRGIYILDDYSPLRQLGKDTREKDAFIFPVKDAMMYIQDGGRYGQGSNFFYSPNPPYGATITYYLKDIPKTLKQIRQEKEKELVKEKKPIPIPTQEELQAEKNEVPPYLIFTITDSKGTIVREIAAQPSKGTSRITWDLEYYNNFRVDVNEDRFDPYSTGGGGIMALPGKYTVSMSQFFHGEEKLLAGPVEFTAKIYNDNTLPPGDRAAFAAFQEKVGNLVDVVNAAEEFLNELVKQTEYVKQAVQNTPSAPHELLVQATDVEKKLQDITWQFYGQPAAASDEENWPAPPSINSRVSSIVEAYYGNTVIPTQTQLDQYALLEQQFPPLLDQLRQIAQVDLKQLQAELDKYGAPWTPGRIPEWKK